MVRSEGQLPTAKMLDEFLADGITDTSDMTRSPRMTFAMLFQTPAHDTPCHCFKTPLPTCHR